MVGNKRFRIKASDGGQVVEFYAATSSTDRYAKFTGRVYPSVDNLYDLGYSSSAWRSLYLSPNNTSLPGVNGQMRAYATANALAWRMGDTVHYGAARISNFHDPVREEGANIDADLTSCTVKGALRRQGRVIRVVAAGTGKVVKGAVNMPYFNIALTFAGTTLAEYTHSPSGEDTYSYAWRLEALILCESNTVAHVRGRTAATYKTGTGDPWPGGGGLASANASIVEHVWEDGDHLTLGDGTDYSVAVHLDIDDGTGNAYGEVTHFLVEVL